MECGRCSRWESGKVSHKRYWNRSLNDGGKKTGLVKIGKEYSRHSVQRPQDGSKIEGCRNSEKGPVDWGRKQDYSQINLLPHTPLPLLLERPLTPPLSTEHGWNLFICFSNVLLLSSRPPASLMQGKHIDVLFSKNRLQFFWELSPWPIMFLFIQG